jgi:hypothetical protein
MMRFKKALKLAGFVPGFILVSHVALALSGPTAIEIDGGPLGPLSLSGGVDGYGYVNTNISQGAQQEGANIDEALVDLQKNTGIIRFNIAIGSTSYQTLGAVYRGTSRVPQTTINNYRTGPLFLGYLTIAPPASPVTFSAGHLASLEGDEATVDWYNASQLTTALFYMANSSADGVEATLTKGPVSATVEYGDGYDSGVWNVLQAIATYTFDPDNIANVYGGINLGKTGPNTFTFGGGKTGLGNGYVNSEIIGSYYNYTTGNLSLTPEVQYQYVKTDHQIGIEGPSSNFGAALFEDYSFGTTPYSLGGWVEYYNSHTSSASNYAFFVGPNSEVIGAAISPTWQYKDLFARVNAGYLYLLNNKGPSGTSYGYGTSGTDRGQFTGTLEAGLLF